MADIDELEPLTTEEWNIAADLINCLAILEGATAKLSGENYATASMIIPLVKICFEELASLNITSKAVLRFRANLASNCATRFKFTESHKFLCMSTLVDPRFKKYGFSSQDLTNKALTYLREKLKSLDSNNQSAQEQATSVSTQPKAKKPRHACDIDSIVELAINKRIESSGEYQHQTIDEEIERFMLEPVCNIKENIFSWWHKNKSRFPLIYGIAKKTIIVPATSTPSERVFSTAGLILTEKRSRLKPDHLDMLIFLNRNLMEKN